MPVELLEVAEGFSLYTSSVDEAKFIYKEIYEDHCYDLPNLPAAPVLVDAGANIGMFSIYMKQKYPAATILAFEPAPETYDVLRRNLALHSAAAGVATHDCGLSAEASGAETLTYYPNLPGNSTLNPEQKVRVREVIAEQYGKDFADARFGGATEVEVKLRRLSEFLGDVERVDLLKVDVEGAELGVLQGVDEADWPKIRNVVLETGEGSGVRVQIEELLEAKGFKVAREDAPWAPGEFFMISASRE